MSRALCVSRRWRQGQVRLFIIDRATPTNIVATVRNKPHDMEIRCRTMNSMAPIFLAR
jgi:hypothetical protein